MTALHNSHLKLPPPQTTPPVVELVSQATLDLLASLPVPPQRLRVSAADVTVDLDWRTRPTLGSGEPAGPETPLPAPPTAAPPGPDTSSDAGEDLRHICAPTVGVFYHAPEPGAPPFVTEGAAVTPGQQIGLIEAMKLFLPVEAEHGGQVVAVLVADGQAVEYGEPLLALAPTDVG